jgi:DNA polymerase-1
MQENVIIDGSNLAYRIHYALKLATTPLTDKEGRPTGLLFGFLKSLASLKTRFDSHSFYVVWDGSKERRKSRYAGYKANRNSENIFVDGQVDAIRKSLPLLGVFQVNNPGEEADDVIATLVRGPLAGQRNTIVSTDRDFLQLVTYTTNLMVPKVGTNSEAIYDTDRVVAEYGVPPNKIVELRALLGDTSDNLPGVPTVSDKVLNGLLRTHGSVVGVYGSQLAGLTPKQYEKVKGAKAQVLLNLELMALYDVPLTTIDGLCAEQEVRDLLTGYEIQPDVVVAPFFKANVAKGFVKTS